MAEKWLEDLQGKDVPRQSEAAHALYNIPANMIKNANATAILCNAVSNGAEWPVRSMAIKILAKRLAILPEESHRVLPALTLGTQDPDFRVRLAALSVLPSILRQHPAHALAFQTILQERQAIETDVNVRKALEYGLRDCTCIIENAVTVEQRLRAKAQPLIDFINAAAKLDNGYPDRYTGPRDGVFDAEVYSWNADWRDRPGYTMDTPLVHFSTIAENAHGSRLTVNIHMRDHRYNEGRSASTEVTFYEDGTSQLRFACHLIGEDLPREPQTTMTVGQIIWIVARTYFHFSREQTRSGQIADLAGQYGGTAPPPGRLTH